MIRSAVSEIWRFAHFYVNLWPIQDVRDVTSPWKGWGAEADRYSHWKVWLSTLVHGCRTRLLKIFHLFKGVPEGEKGEGCPVLLPGCEHRLHNVVNHGLPRLKELLPPVELGWSCLPCGSFQCHQYPRRTQELAFLWCSGEAARGKHQALLWHSQRLWQSADVWTLHWDKYGCLKCLRKKVSIKMGTPLTQWLMVLSRKFDQLLTLSNYLYAKQIYKDLISMLCQNRAWQQRKRRQCKHS